MIISIISLLSGTTVGLLLGLTGAGGGVFAIPLLTLVMGFSLQEAKPIALIAIAIGALFGVLQAVNVGQLRWRAALFIAGIGSLFAQVGNKLSSLIPASFMVTSFSILMLYMACGLFKQAATPCKPDHCNDQAQDRPCQLNKATGRFFWTRKCATTLATVGASSGLFSGLYGVGGGFVLVPSLTKASNISISSTTATSLMVIALVSSISALSMIQQGVHINDIGIDFIITAGFGTLLGRAAIPHVSMRFVQFSLGVLMISTALLFLLFR